MIENSSFQPDSADSLPLDEQQIPDQLRDIVHEQQNGFVSRGQSYNSGNLLAMVQYYNRVTSGVAPGDYRQGLVDSAIEARTLADEAGIEDGVNPTAVQNLLDAGIYVSETFDLKSARRPLVYETVEDRQQAANGLIDERLSQADTYPYYDLYRRQGMLHEPEGGLPYVELYRSTAGDQVIQLAGGLRSGVFSTEELTELPPSVRLAAVEGLGSAAKIAELEASFSMDQIEAFAIGDSAHNESAYLSASRQDSDKFSGDTVLTLHVPACLTLPVEFLQAPVEQHIAAMYSHQNGLPVPAPREDREKEIAILGGIRPEWVVGRRTKMIKTDI